jgi:hypothetical protein
VPFIRRHEGVERTELSLDMGPVTIAQLQAEGQIANGAEDMSATVTVGPEAEARVGGRKITFGPGIYAGIAKDKDGVQVEGGVKFSRPCFSEAGNPLRSQGIE